MKTTILADNTGKFRIILAEYDLPESIAVNDEIQCLVDTQATLRCRVTKKTWIISDTKEIAVELFVHEADKDTSDYVATQFTKRLKEDEGP